MQDELLERFKTRLADVGLSISNIDDEGQIHIDFDDNTLKISLNNVRKSYEQDGTLDHLENLVQSIRDYMMEEQIPAWPESEEKVFWSLFPGNFEFGNHINERVTSDFHKYYVSYVNGQYVWINHKQLSIWNISEHEFKKQVDKNMNDLLEKSTNEVLEMESGARLAYFNTEMEELKSALLLSKNLKLKISPVIGYPVYCVLPVRDFCYMFNEQDKDELINALGETVLKEYRNSGYEISTEILKISNAGIEPIGKYEA